VSAAECGEGVGDLAALGLDEVEQLVGGAGVLGADGVGADGLWYAPAHEGRDDFLVSLALCCAAAQGAARPTADAVVRPRRVEYGD